MTLSPAARLRARERFDGVWRPGYYVLFYASNGRGPVRGLIFDPFAGISGDMVLGALVDLDPEATWLRDTVAATGLDVKVGVERVQRRGVACHRVWFEAASDQPERHLSDVLEVIDAAGVADAARHVAANAFRRLAEAEAEVHGTDVERIHFHEVGAVDSILDVLCTAVAVVERGYDAFYTRPVTVGRGTVEMAHGRYPLPAPATAKLLAGLPVRDPGYEGECTTPTGAALLATLTDGRTQPGEVVLGATGFGAGVRDPEGRPNCLRVMECDVVGREDTLYVVQSDLDDMPAEYAAAAQAALLEKGAQDAVVLPLAMKKGRQGLRLEVLASADRLEAVVGVIFASTSTAGVRYWPVQRTALPRSEEVQEWRGQEIRRKRVRLPDGSERSKPEYEDVVRAAQALGLSPYEVRMALERDVKAPDNEKLK